MKKIYLLLFGLILITSSCNKEEIDVFSSDDAGVFFQYRSSWIYGTGTEFYTDSLTFSFASAPPTSTETTIFADIKTLGKVVDYDRPVKVVIDPAGTTAIEGVHYEVNFDTLRVAAGENGVRAPIRFLRSPDLLTKSFRVAIRLEENEHFKLYIDEYKDTNSYTASGNMLSGTEFSFTFSEKYSQPGYWTWFGNDYFGPWTATKYVYVNSILELTNDDWNRAGQTGAKVAGGRFNFFGQKVQKALQERADNDDPVLDEDGKPMQLGPENLVDYSRYE